MLSELSPISFSSSVPVAEVVEVSEEETSDNLNTVLKESFPEGLTLQEAAYVYGCSKKQLRQLIAEGQIPAMRVQKRNKLKWRVYPGGLPDEAEPTTSSSITSTTTSSFSSECSELLDFSVPEELSFSPDTAGDSVVQVSAVDVELSTSDTGSLTNFSSDSLLQMNTYAESASDSYFETDFVSSSEQPPHTRGLSAEFAVLNHVSGEITEVIESSTKDGLGADAASVATDSVVSVVLESNEGPRNLQALASPVAIDSLTASEADSCAPCDSEAVVETDFAAADVLNAERVCNGADLDQSAAKMECETSVAKQPPGTLEVLQNRLDYLEEVVSKLSYQNGYLETRLAALEDQVKYLTGTAHRRVGFSAVLFGAPWLIILFAIVSVCLQ